ncbi:MAG: TolC family protein [Bradymonadia bacterium]
MRIVLPGFCVLVSLSSLPGGMALAQRPTQVKAQATEQSISLSLAEAIELALAQDYALRQSRLSLETAEAQVDEVWGSVYPSVNLNAGYTRNFEAANPFAGSNAGGLFGGLGAIDWLAFNEAARTDDDPNTNPIPIGEFFERQAAGRAAAGIEDNSGGNPFFVPNQFNASITVNQLLYNGGTFDAIEGARVFEGQSAEGVRQRAHQVVSEVGQAYYGVLLAQAGESVLARSVERARAAVDEAKKRVDRGVAPKFHLLTAEVELTNLETRRLQASNQVGQAEDALRLALALPTARTLTLTEQLAPPAPDDETIDLASAEVPEAPEATEDDTPLPDLDRAIDDALEKRPDVAQLRLTLKYQGILREAARSDFGPRVEAFVQGGYVGQVPDDRTRVVSDPDDPFSFRQEDVSFFSGDYWFPTVSAGITLSWNIFDGFATTARVEQQTLAVRRTQVQYEQVTAGVRVEVAGAHRALAEAKARMKAQARNVGQAALNYAHARVRVKEGVSSQIELRAASEQLDQARLNRLQAVHDHRVAQLAFLVATGQPPHLNTRGTP